MLLFGTSRSSLWASLAIRRSACDPPCVLVQQAAVAAPAGSEYGQLLSVLDDAAAREIDTCLASLPVLTEPHIARELSRVLPAGREGSSCMQQLVRQHACMSPC